MVRLNLEHGTDMQIILQRSLGVTPVPNTHNAIYLSALHYGVLH